MGYSDEEEERICQHFAAVQEPLLASHPAHQLLENGIPQIMFVNVVGCVSVCEKKGKEGGGRL